MLAAVVTLACLAAVGVAVSKPDGKPAKTHREYYLALGDSLSRGAQPNASGQTVPTDQGYANDLYSAEKKNFKDLAFKDLGCLGETTETMMKGGICHYAAGSQLKAAVNFLRNHKGHIAFVTIDIGANDIDRCVSGTTVDLACLSRGEAAIARDIPKIAGALHMAAGPKVRVVGMTYYDPFLADWFAGPSGQAVAASSQQLARPVNRAITNAYESEHVSIATVGAAFHTYAPFKKTETFHGQQVPLAVIEVCKLTSMCAPSPRGPNIHLNAAGYRGIAAVFEEHQL